VNYGSRLVGALLFVGAALASWACGGNDSATAPSNTPPPAQGSVSLGLYQLAIVSIRVDRGGSLTARLNWASATNDINAALLPRACTLEQVLLDAPGCNDAAATVFDQSAAKPTVLNAAVQPGSYTLVLLNFGPGAETVSYQLEGVPVTPGAPVASPPRRTDTFPFTLRAGSSASVLAGPVRAAIGPMDVTESFNGDYVILVCVGTAVSCQPFGGRVGGRPTTMTYVIGDDFPAGSIQGQVYFNRNVTQPPGDANGTVTFTYSPLP
jgi:hypothetical protein